MIKDIESKRDEIIAEANGTNSAYSLNYVLDDDITCTSLIEELKESVEVSREQVRAKFDLSAQTNDSLKEIEEVCDSINNQLDDDMDSAKLQVFIKGRMDNCRCIY